MQQVITAILAVHLYAGVFALIFTKTSAITLIDKLTNFIVNSEITLGITCSKLDDDDDDDGLPFSVQRLAPLTTYEG